MAPPAPTLDPACKLILPALSDDPVLIEMSPTESDAVFVRSLIAPDIPVDVFVDRTATEPEELESVDTL